MLPPHHNVGSEYNQARRARLSVENSRWQQGLRMSPSLFDSGFSLFPRSYSLVKVLCCMHSHIQSILCLARLGLCDRDSSVAWTGNRTCGPPNKRPQLPEDGNHAQMLGVHSPHIFASSNVLLCSASFAAICVHCVVTTQLYLRQGARIPNPWRCVKNKPVPRLWEI